MYKLTQKKPVFFMFTLLMLLVTGGCGTAQNSTPSVPREVNILVGTYTFGNEQELKSEGFYRLPLDTEALTFGTPQLLQKANNPSFAAISADRQAIYLLNEAGPGEISAYHFGREGLRLINTLPSHGNHPCYVAINSVGNRVALANYGTGNIAVYDIDPDSKGLIGEPSLLQHHGSGPLSPRQDKPHAHWVNWGPDERYLYAVDLGADAIFIYDAELELIPNKVGRIAYSFPAGSGPRHMAFHPTRPFAYVLSELSNTLDAFRINSEDGSLMPLMRQSTLPPSYKGASQAGHIAISDDGKHLYVSNRGHNSIAVFSLDASGGFKHLQTISTGGDWPRFFLLLNNLDLMLVANQNSNDIYLFRIDDKGRLVATDNKVSIAKPVFLALSPDAL